MSRIVGSILRKLATPRDRELLEQSPSLTTYMRVMGRVGLRFWPAYLVLLFVLIVGTASAGMDVYHRTEQPQFCGACHEMGANFSSWSESRHKNIACGDCHSGQGALGWMQAKAAGVKQLKVHFTSADFAGIKIEPHQVGIINNNCMRCHQGVARVNERFGLGVSHRQHLDKGVSCIDCHSGLFAHPAQPKKASAVQEAGGEDEAAKSADADAGIPDPGQPRFVDVAECYACHDGKNQVGGERVFSAQDETKCLSCHPDADHALAHGAKDPKSATRKPCLDCHEVAEGQVHYAMGSSVASMCEKCHEKQKHESRHSPYKKGECNECHKVMSPAYAFKLGPRPTNALCLDCHDELAEMIRGPEPTETRSFAEADKDLHWTHAAELGKQRADFCMDCHSGHGSDAEWGLLRLREGPDGKAPGTLALDDTGGTCAGGCHDTTVRWTQP